MMNGLADLLGVRSEQILGDLIGVDAKEITSDDMEHFGVLLEAMKICHEREKVYQGAWKRYGALDSAMHLRSKGLRAFQRVMGWIKEGGLPSEPDLDDSLDFINYATFMVRNVRDGRLGDE